MPEFEEKIIIMIIGANKNQINSENTKKIYIKNMGKLEDMGNSNRKKLPPIENPGIFQRVEQSLSEIKLD